MDISQINWLAVLVSSLSTFAIGAIWFGPVTFYPIWWKALGKDMPNPEDRNKPGAAKEAAIMFSSTYVAGFVQAAVLAIVIQLARAASPDFTWLTGAGLGLLLGFGVGAAASLGHRLFAQQGWRVWLIEIGADVVALTVAGAIIGAWV